MAKLGLGLLLGLKLLAAEDTSVIEENITTSGENTTISEVEEDTNTSVDITPDEGNEIDTEEELKESLIDWLSQYVEKSAVEKIVGWALDCGLLGALFGVYLKYKKYKATTIEDLVEMTKKEIGKYLSERFDNLSSEQINKITGSIETLEKSNETIMKVLVLMQDSTAKGKTALIDYLGSKTNNAEVKEATTEVKKELEAQEKVDAEIKDKVKGNYEDIF